MMPKKLALTRTFTPRRLDLFNALTIRIRSHLITAQGLLRRRFQWRADGYHCRQEKLRQQLELDKQQAEIRLRMHF